MLAREREMDVLCEVALEQTAEGNQWLILAEVGLGTPDATQFGQFARLASAKMPS